MTTKAWSQASIQADMGGGSKKDEKFKFIPLLSIDHNEGFRKDVDATTDFSLNLTGAINKKHTIQILQVATKYYLIDPEQNEVEFSDTFLFHHWRAYRGKYFSATLRNSYTLPVSTSSERNGTMGRWEQRIAFSKAFFGGKLFVAYRPFYRIFFNKYKVGEAGQPLNQYSYGHNILGVVSLPKNFSIVALAGQTINHTEESQYETNPIQSNETYFVTGYLNYQALKSLSIRAGYLQANSAIINGRNEVYFFDEENSRWNIGVDYSF